MISAKFVVGYKVCYFTVSTFLSSDLPFIPQWNEVVSRGMAGTKSLKILYIRHRQFFFLCASNEGKPSSSNITVIEPASLDRQSCLMKRVGPFFQYHFEGRVPR